MEYVHENNSVPEPSYDKRNGFRHRLIACKPQALNNNKRHC